MYRTRPTQPAAMNRRRLKRTSTKDHCPRLHRRVNLRLREHVSVHMRPKTTMPSAADAAMHPADCVQHIHAPADVPRQPHLRISRGSKHDSQGKQTGALRPAHDSDVKYHGINWPLNSGQTWLKGQECATPTANKPHAARPFLLRPITSVEPILTQPSTPVHPNVYCITLIYTHLIRVSSNTQTLTKHTKKAPIGGSFTVGQTDDVHSPGVKLTMKNK